MKKRVRIKDIAEKAGVSVGTVDRVLHKRGDVAEDVVKKVLQVMDELGYERNLIASTLAFNRQIRIATLLPNCQMDAYWVQPLEGIQMAAKSLKHYGVTVENTFFDLFNPDDFLAKARAVLRQKPDGLLFPPLFKREGLQVLDECERVNIPVVQINTYVEHPHVLSYIGQDSFQSGVLAARLLNFALRDGEPALVLNLEKGIANASHLMEKERGFRYYFANNRQKNIHVLTSNFEDFENTGHLRAYLSSFTNGTAQIGGIFVTNSRAYKVIECLEEENLAKMFIVGFDLLEPNINHLHQNKINFLINQNPVEQGYLGVLSLFKHLFLKETPERLQFLPLDIVVAENVQYYLHRQKQIIQFY